MTFQDISESLVSIAKEEGLSVTYCSDRPVIQNGSKRMGLVVSGDYDLSFYFKNGLHRGLLIHREPNLDFALSRGLDFIYG